MIGVRSLNFKNLAGNVSRVIAKLVESPRANVVTTGRQRRASGSEDDRMKSSVICRLHQSPKHGSNKNKRNNSSNSTMDIQYCHPFPHYFELNQCRFYFDSKTGACVDGGPLLQQAPLEELKELARKGLSQAQRITAEERYKPYNRPILATPTIQEAFFARISTPLVVIQLLGRLLSCLEEGFQAVTNACFTVGQHYLNARQAILSARQMAKEVQTSVKIHPV